MSDGSGSAPAQLATAHWIGRLELHSCADLKCEAIMPLMLCSVFIESAVRYMIDGFHDIEFGAIPIPDEA